MSRNPAVKAVNKWSRSLHRWGAILISLPLLVVIGTGLVLQLKKESAWIQPPTARGVGEAPEIAFDEILAAARSVPKAQVETWDDIDRLDVRPDKGIVKVRANSRWEVQVDTQTGDVVQVAYRRSDLIESLHDGSFFSDWTKLYVFLPSGAILLGLLVTGIYLFFLPLIARRRGRIRRARRRAERTA